MQVSLLRRPIARCQRDECRPERLAACRGRRVDADGGGREAIYILSVHKESQALVPCGPRVAVNSDLRYLVQVQLIEGNHGTGVYPEQAHGVAIVQVYGGH